MDLKDLTDLSTIKKQTLDSAESNFETTPETPPADPFSASDFEPIAPAETAPEPVEAPLPEVINEELQKEVAPEVINEELQKIVEESITGKTLPIVAAYPFHVTLEGKLRPQDREKISDLITGLGLNLKPEDFQNQFEAGRVLIPRISEYAAIHLIQNLRDLPLEISLSPSDEPVPSNPTSPPLDQNHFSPLPADSIPITTGKLENSQIITTLTASAILPAAWVEESSTDYQTILERLQVELRSKAFYQGAHAIELFQVQLQTLATYPISYRLLSTGVAVQLKNLTSPPNPLA